MLETSLQSVSNETLPGSLDAFSRKQSIPGLEQLEVFEITQPKVSLDTSNHTFTNLTDLYFAYQNKPSQKVPIIGNQSLPTSGHFYFGYRPPTAKSLPSPNTQYLPKSIYSYSWPNVKTFNTIGISITAEEINLIRIAMPPLVKLKVSGNIFPIFSKFIGKAHNSTSVEDATFTKGLLQEIRYVTLGRALKKLNLTHNLIENISTTAFKDSKALEVLDLSHNRIWSLSKNLFIYNTVLSYLFLDHNYLTYLHPEHVRGLKHLTHLSLTHNRIYSFTLNTLLHMPWLSVMKLSYNKISSLTFTRSLPSKQYPVFPTSRTRAQ